MLQIYKGKDAFETLVKLKDELDTLKECINGFQPLTNVSGASLLWLLRNILPKKARTEFTSSTQSI